MNIETLSSDFVNTGIEQAVLVVKQGGVVAFPTETYYGLAVDPFNEQALTRLFDIKNRPAFKPLLTLVDIPENVSLLAANVPSQLRPLMQKFWPGPLTLVFPAKLGLSKILTGNSDTVGIRVSPHPVARNFVGRLGAPLTATSANISGKSPATSMQGVLSQFGKKIDFIIDAGNTPGGMGSTVVGVSGDGIKLLRAGKIPFFQVQQTIARKIGFFTELS